MKCYNMVKNSDLAKVTYKLTLLKLVSTSRVSTAWHFLSSSVELLFVRPFHLVIYKSLKSSVIWFSIVQ